MIFVSSDVMFWARVRAEAEASGTNVVRVDDEAAMRAAFERGGVSRILADLEVRGVDPLEWAPRWKGRPDPPILVAFGSHVDPARLAAAVDAGFDTVMPRSRFHRSLAELLRG